MAVTTIPSTVAGQTVIRNDAARAQSAALSKATLESTTRRVGDTLEVTDPRTFFTQKLDAWGKKIVEHNNDVKGQISLQLKTLEGMRDLVQRILPSFSNIALQTDAGTADAVKIKAEESLGILMSALSTTYGDRYIFGGIDIYTRPITSLIVDVDGTGAVNTSYDTTESTSMVNVSLRPDQSSSDLIDITACVSDSYIERTVTALNLARRGYFAKAAEVGDVALSQINARIADVGAKIGHVNAVNKALSDETDQVIDSLERLTTIDFDELMAATQSSLEIQMARELSADVQTHQWRSLGELLKTIKST